MSSSSQPDMIQNLPFGIYKKYVIKTMRQYTDNASFADTWFGLTNVLDYQHTYTRFSKQQKCWVTQNKT